jgi:DNA-binding MarR family transcriptional regulator
MVEGGILERRPDPADRRKVIYSLSPKGEALLPVVLALRQWGEDWGHGTQQIVLADQRDGVPIRRIAVQAADGRELKLGELMWVDRPAGT